jgi:sec-independent protein translocase protein TatB
MSGVGFWELILLFLIGLIVLGPERLPRVANQLGSWLGQARRMTRVLKRQLEDELNLEKDSSIRPRSVPKVLPPRPSPELDDTYSPAHDADSPGTGARGAPPADDNEFCDTDVLDEARAGSIGGVANGDAGGSDGGTDRVPPASNSKT